MFNLSTEPLANASIAIIRSGFISFTIPFIKSLVSIPVAAKTPGLIPNVLIKPSSTLEYSNKWFVIKILSITNGPKASGVLLLFPNPTIRTLDSELISTIFFNSLVNTFLTFSLLL